MYEYILVSDILYHIIIILNVYKYISIDVLITYNSVL